ncbi:SusD/RagB family nutrient-binding outer membrane lipoprotein [Mucilaginibacter sp. McL0603]|uniref:SusD/RagB family nutrient-binding outer membrane lipoprotein n=1 Tax=Mucilaginibacter sp. McL0603 TaxID=3415670 RepID=UPI003CEA6E57
MKLKPIYILATAVIITAFASCKKDLLKTNTDPNAVSVDLFDPNNILTTTQLFYTGSTDNAIEVEETEIQGAGCYIQHWASTSGYYFGDKYSLSPGGWGSFFDHAYTYGVKYAVDLYTNTAGKPQYKNLHQISRIMKALIFERITDVYGDVPYFNAGQAYTKSIYFPVYDKQKDIYADLLKEVSQATDSLDVNADKPTGDQFYSGADDQIGEWKKFGNTLLLRMAMRLTKVDPATAKTYVQKVIGHTMESNADNAILQHGTNDPLTINRIYRGIGEDGAIQLDGQISKTFIDTLKVHNDPRLPVLAYVYPLDFEAGGDPSNGSSVPAEQYGLPNGYNSGNAANGIQNYLGNPASPGVPFNPAYSVLGSLAAYSRPSPIIFNATAPTLILTYAESELLLADAAKRWGIGGSAQTHYNNGVLAAMAMLSAYGDAGTISDGDAQAYLDANPYKDANGLNMINTQYWIATFFNEYEAWSNYRRTGYPVLKGVVYPGSQSPGAVPRRMEYSTVDKQVNSTNYTTAVAGIPGGDKITSRVWWDTQ